MTRTIPIDADTSISYIFPEKVFQITNKETNTTRTTAQNAKDVLDIVAPSNTLTPQELIDTLVTPLEELKELSYTWSTSGEYIQTIQLNDYAKNPLTLDLSQNKLYIMNSSIIYDLTLNEPSTQRIKYVQSYYMNHLGLYVSENDLKKIYDLLYSFYLPTVYNTIGTREVYPDGSLKPLTYTNTIQLSNHSDTSPVTYTLTMNPNGTYEYPPIQIGRILQLQENVITLASNPTETVTIGQSLTLYNTNTIVNGTTYSADGTYAVTNVENNIITVDENFPTPYLYEPPTLNVAAYKSLITSIERDANTIHVNNQADLSDFLIGDKIEVRGTIINTEYENQGNGNQITVDGTYTIQDIQAHKIITEEQPLTNYEYDTGNQPYLYKNIFVQNISSIDEATKKVVTLEDTPEITLTNSTNVVVIYQDKSESYSTVNSVNNKTVNVTTALSNSFTNNSGILQKRTPSPEVLIQITNSTDEVLMPDTTFMVDTKAEANAYLELKEGIKVPDLDTPDTLTVPTNACYTNSNKQVDTTYYIGINNAELEYMNLLGLYSEIYS